MKVISVEVDEEFAKALEKEEVKKEMGEKDGTA